MTSARDEFLQQVRKAVADGNRAGHVAALEPRGSVGYQGAGFDVVARFRTEHTAAGGLFHLVPDHATAAVCVLDLVRQHEAHRVLLGAGAVVSALQVSDPLTAAGVEVVPIANLGADARAAFFAADVGISGVDYLI